MKDRLATRHVRAIVLAARGHQLLGCAHPKFCLRSQNSSGLARGGLSTWLSCPGMDATEGMDTWMDSLRHELRQLLCSCRHARTSSRHPPAPNLRVCSLAALQGT